MTTTTGFHVRSTSLAVDDTQSQETRRNTLRQRTSISIHTNIPLVHDPHHPFVQRRVSGGNTLRGPVQSLFVSSPSNSPSTADEESPITPPPLRATHVSKQLSSLKPKHIPAPLKLHSSSSSSSAQPVNASSPRKRESQTFLTAPDLNRDLPPSPSSPALPPPPSESEIIQRRLDKIRRTLGERVPEELVKPAVRSSTLPPVLEHEWISGAGSSRPHTITNNNNLFITPPRRASSIPLSFSHAAPDIPMMPLRLSPNRRVSWMTPAGRHDLHEHVQRRSARPESMGPLSPLVFSSPEASINPSYVWADANDSGQSLKFKLTINAPPDEDHHDNEDDDNEEDGRYSPSPPSSSRSSISFSHDHSSQAHTDSRSHSPDSGRSEQGTQAFGSRTSFHSTSTLPRVHALLPFSSSSSIASRSTTPPPTTTTASTSTSQLQPPLPPQPPSMTMSLTRAERHAVQRLHPEAAWLARPETPFSTATVVSSRRSHERGDHTDEENSPVYEVAERRVEGGGGGKKGIWKHDQIRVLTRREKRQGWSGEWNRGDMQDVIKTLRNLK